MTLRAVVFDLWGTLMTERRELFPERARIRYEGVRPVLERHGLFIPQDDFTRLHLASNRTLARLQEHGRDVSAEHRARHVIYQIRPGLADRLTDEDVDEFVEGYGGAVLETLPVLLEGAAEAVLEAQRRGLRVGLISNTGVSGGRHLREVFARHGLLDAFDSLVFSDEHQMAKPHPEVFATALRELGVTADEAVFVGDTPRYDVSPPRRYGWWVVQVGDRDDGDPSAHVRVPGVGDLFRGLGTLGLLPER
ncbi:MAG: HAD family hydrolase [Chloroflexi bacterium]|nr:HAD family hydrolase [Chloroflexota bacterium]MDA1240871.1 HAD family hydrolase [Chloroflexota bacterium]MQC19112.1 HAD family hydrolase [Chloroflexota bacterium]